MSYTGYVLLFVSTAVIMGIAWRFLKFQDARYEKEMQEKIAQEKLEEEN